MVCFVNEHLLKIQGSHWLLHSNLIPWASVRLVPWLIVMVERRIYCFQESDPDSRPPPVCFSPPNAPPISAPLVGMLTFTMPQSEPFGPIHLKNKNSYLNVGPMTTDKVFMSSLFYMIHLLRNVQTLRLQLVPPNPLAIV